MIFRIIAASLFLFLGLGFVAILYISWIQLKDSLDAMGEAGRKRANEKFWSGDWKDD